jgi:outer membrane biosynthesis protein TonB
VYDNSGDSARRLSFSFITVLALHAALLWTLNVSSISQRERGKLITNVELQRYAAPELKAPAPAAPESLAAPALPGGKPAAASFALPVQRPAERQVAIIDQLPAQQQRQTQAAADRLVH